MPITAKLSRKFYEKFGDELTNELVGLLNNVDTSYRTELRDLNESNFARSDAKLGALESRLDAKFGALESRLDARFDAFEATLDAKLARMEGGLIARIGQVEARLARQTMMYWIATLGTIVALLKL